MGSINAQRANFSIYAYSKSKTKSVDMEPLMRIIFIRYARYVKIAKQNIPAHHAVNKSARFALLKKGYYLKDTCVLTANR